MTPNNNIQIQIKSIWSNAIQEGVSGRLFCTNAGLIKIASLIGLDYKIMSKEKKKQFRNDVISGYQMGYFRKYGNY